MSEVRIDRTGRAVKERESRTDKGISLAADRAQEIVLLPSGLYRVPSCARERSYTVDLVRQSCTCPDRQIAGRRCKHLVAAGIVHAGRVRREARAAEEAELYRRVRLAEERVRREKLAAGGFRCGVSREAWDEVERARAEYRALFEGAA